jgi:lethal(2) giant larvae protein
LPFETIQTSPPKAAKTTSPTAATNSDGANESTANEMVHTESALLCLTNLGDCLVLTVPELKRQLNAAAIRREDIK